MFHVAICSSPKVRRAAAEAELDTHGLKIWQRHEVNEVRADNVVVVVVGAGTAVLQAAQAAIRNS